VNVVMSNNALERTLNHRGALCLCEWASCPALNLVVRGQKGINENLHAPLPFASLTFHVELQTCHLRTGIRSLRCEFVSLVGHQV
jgi:hypothetical protein